MSPIQSTIFQKAVRNFPRIFNNKRRLWNQNLAIFGKVLNNFGKSDDMIVKKWWYSLDAGMVLYPKSKKKSWAVSHLDDLGVVHAVAPPIPA